MLNFIAKKILGTKNEREIKKIKPIVEKINSLEKDFEKKSQAELRELISKFKKALTDIREKYKDDDVKSAKEQFKYMDKILPEVFAAVREASKRTLGLRHFDVQLIGGVVLHQGKIAEMKTGEGKTLVATLAATLNALAQRGVHIVTVNDYLAKRDAEWMGPIYRYLGLTVGYLQQDMEKEERKKAYACDITYGTNSEFGFDYLRDNMAFSKEEQVQRELFYAIVDEADSILIDEARTPLIISGPSDENPEVYYLADYIVRQLKKDEDFEVDEKTKTAVLTDKGIKKVEAILEKFIDKDLYGVKEINLYDPKLSELLHAILQSLRAHYLFKRDIDYMVIDNKVVIIDEFTGRLMDGRRWSDGLHQAVEAKEGVPIESENQTLATITLQNYFKLYKKLAGMTGTAETEAAELKAIYGLDVVVIPTNKPIRRIDHPDVIYKTKAAKWKAVVEEIKKEHAKGRPILVGTKSVEDSELLSNLLKQEGIPHQVLNAKYHEKEAEIVAQAGRLGAVTIATNMAGRGTDILLGGNPEYLAKSELKEKGITLDSIKEMLRKEYPNLSDFELDEKAYEIYEDLLKENLEKWKKITEKEKEKVKELGGLYVIGTERHESRRIDNQLRGRSGRQGDPGETRFFLSLEDDLLRLFGADKIQKLMNFMNIPEDEPITHKMVSKALETAQQKVEQMHFQIRKRLLEFDEVYNVQRKVIYEQRNKILKGENIKEEILAMIEDVITDLVDMFVPEEELPENWNLKGLKDYVEKNYGVPLPSFPTSLEELEKIELDEDDEREKIKILLLKAFLNLYEEGEKVLGESELRELERLTLLQNLDHYWREHLRNLDHLREGIGLRGYGQKDPVVEFKKESFELFKDLIKTIKHSTISSLMQYLHFNVKEAKDKMA
ncbi:MAG TPA: preprotein translocase subunit SecA [Desulfurobacteriaceae bacterium]|nr:preprotein translocase subunit SecA [Desulfurobacteriaceae bacterium]